MNLPLAQRPAFPFTYEDRRTAGITNTMVSAGLSTREHFAALAMQGLLADPDDHADERRSHDETPDGKRCDAAYSGPRKVVFDETCAQAVARLAVEHADALLAQLEKGV